MKAVAATLYGSVLTAARQPGLYGSLGVPDTVDGRFDMIVIHAVLIMRRLREGGEAGKAAAQALFDHMFDDMDAALREMGTGDLSVGKKIRAMGEAFYGRATAYDASLKADDPALLVAALKRNMLDDSELSDAAAQHLSNYVLACHARLGGQDPAALIAGTTPDFAIAEPTPD